MIRYFNKTSIGYSHLQSGKICQDFSGTYHDDERTIVTACDGHGGNLYIRSDLGSRFASDAIIDTFRRFDKNSFRKYPRTEIIKKLRLEILCEWNARVEKDLSNNPIKKKEYENLSEDEVFKLKMNPAKAYGTTLNGVMVIGNKLICANLGDGGVFAVRKGNIFQLFEEDEETVANITYSMCQEDAFNHLSVEAYDFSDVDGVIVCTDGTINPYQNLKNFNESFVKPIINKMIKENYDEIDEFISKLGVQMGVGDDVSFAAIVKNDISFKPYKN